MHLNPVLKVPRLAAGLLLAAAPLAAPAALVFEQVNGANLIYDTTTKDYWTQDGNLSGQTFTWTAARQWAAGLSYAGASPSSWQLPTVNQFVSFYEQLPGADHSAKYGSQVSFGPGPNDFASNIQLQYWAADPTGLVSGVPFSTDFNFVYGYGGNQAQSVLFSAWAVTSVVPEAGGVPAGLLALGLVGVALSRRAQGVRS